MVVDDGWEDGVGAWILAELGISSTRLMTENPARCGWVERFGLPITELVPLSLSRSRPRRRR